MCALLKLHCFKPCALPARSRGSFLSYSNKYNTEKDIRKKLRDGQRDFHTAFSTSHNVVFTVYTRF